MAKIILADSDSEPNTVPAILVLERLPRGLLDFVREFLIFGIFTNKLHIGPEGLFRASPALTLHKQVCEGAAKV